MSLYYLRDTIYAALFGERIREGEFFGLHHSVFVCASAERGCLQTLAALAQCGRRRSVSWRGVTRRVTNYVEVYRQDVGRLVRYGYTFRPDKEPS